MEWMLCRRRDLYLLTLCVSLFFIWIHVTNIRPGQSHSPATTAYEQSTIPQGPPLPPPVDRAGGGDKSRYQYDSPANATLGFGKILAVSTKTSKRRASLQLAGELTGIEITIPDQPVWTDADVERMKSKQHSQILRASALAWLGHLNALKWLVNSPYETALILEDDVNWDIRIRTKQIPLVARALRDLVTAEHEKGSAASPQLSHQHNALTRSPPSSDEYWPPANDWELLYLGHCGDFFPARNLSTLTHTIYPDPSMPSFEGLHIDTQRFLYPLPVPSHHRILHRSTRPLCTFAYAVTKTSAKRILADLSKEEEHHGTWAYDVRILEACRDLDWKCWSINPELFHHVDEHSSEIQAVNGKPLFGQPSREDIARGKARGTPNVGCGVRGIAEKLGSDKKAREIVAMAAQYDGLCPTPADEIDAMRGQIVISGRDNLPID